MRYTGAKLRAIARAAVAASGRLNVLTRDDPSLEDADQIGLGEFLSRAGQALDDLADYANRQAAK